jgi:trimeric autotransporter adhesin
MNIVFYTKFFNINGFGLKRVLLFLSLFLLVTANLSGQTATASNTGPVCVGSSLSLKGGPDGMSSYSWTGPSGFNSIEQNPLVSASATSNMAGDYTLTVNGDITNTATTTVIVNALPVVTFNGTLTAQCLNSTVYTLSGGLPATGSYSGPGVTGTNFNASIAGVGTKTITYTYTDPNGCVNSATNNIVVNALPAVTFGGTLAAQCVGSTSYTLSGGLPAGGIYSGTGVTGTNFNASVAGVGTHTLTYTYTDPNGCVSSATNNIIVNALPVVTFSGTLTAQCVNSTVYTLSGGLPAGGTYSGTGVTGTNFNASVAGVGNHSITYTYKDANGCTNTAVNNIIVNGLPVVTFSGTLTPQCVSSTVYTLTGGLPSGGTYSGTGVTGTNFNASVAGVGSHSITYTYNDINGCTNTATNSIVVNPLPVAVLTSSDADNIFCQGTSITFTAGDGTNYDFRVGGVTKQSGASSTYTTSSLTNGQVVTVVVTNTNGCSNTSLPIINIVNTPPYIIISTSPTCSPDFLTYSFGVTVTPGATVTCLSGTVVNTSSNIWSISGIPKAVNATVTAVDINGCQSVMVVTAPNCNCPTVLPPVSGGDKSYCTADAIPTINATVQTGETVDWYDSAAGGVLLKSASLSYTPTAAGTYYALTRNIASNCVSSTRTAISVTMNSLPVPTLTSSDADNIFCAGTSVTFTGGGGTNYDFRVGGVSVQSGSSATYTTSALTNGQVVGVVVTNANGCKANSATITNTVYDNPIPTLISSDSDNSFCAGTNVTFTAGGGSSYSFMVNGSSVQTGTMSTYTTNSLVNGQVVSALVSNGNGCTATSLGITNTVNAIPVPTLTSSDIDNTFCSGTSVTFTAGGGTSYNFRVDGVSVQNGSSNTFISSSLTNGQIVDVIVANANGCTATSAGITNSVIQQPVANAGTGGNVCDLNFTFSAVPSSGIGTWTKTTGPGSVTFSPNQNTANATVTVTEYGSYTFTWTEVNGQCSSNSTIGVNFYLQPVANAGSGGNNCGLGFHFNASMNTGLGTWSKVSGPGNVSFSPDANTSNALVTVTDFGTYTFSWTVTNGTCSNTSNVTVVFIQQISADAGPGGDSCSKDFRLNALVPATGTGTWSKVTGPGVAVFTPDNHQANALVTVDKFGSYDFAWTVVNSTCTSSGSATVVFHDLPLINAGKDTAMCKGNSIQLLAVGTGDVTWTPSAFVSNPNILNPVATPDTSTTFTINLTDQYGCKNSDDILIVVKDPLIADAGPDQVLNYLFSTTMDAKLTNSYENGVWSVISGAGDFLDSTLTTTTVNNLALGENKFLWTVTNGFCQPSHDTVLVDVKNFVIPTLITPNMDGRNDYFVLRGLATLGKTELIIFDRRGVQVYRNKNYDNSWNGVDDNNNSLPDDTYFYVIKAENGKSISGYVVIRR